MPKGILCVASRPRSPELEAEYHQWYEEHVRQLVAIDGLVSARRFAPIGEDGPFVAIYEIEADDLEGIHTRMLEAFERGDVTTSPTLQRDPPPISRLYEQISAYEP